MTWFDLICYPNSTCLLSFHYTAADFYIHFDDRQTEVNVYTESGANVVNECRAKVEGTKLACRSGDWHACEHATAFLCARAVTDRQMVGQCVSTPFRIVNANLFGKLTESPSPFSLPAKCLPVSDRACECVSVIRLETAKWQGKEKSNTKFQRARARLGRASACRAHGVGGRRGWQVKVLTILLRSGSIAVNCL